MNLAVRERTSQQIVTKHRATFHPWVSRYTVRNSQGPIQYVFISESILTLQRLNFRQVPRHLLQRISSPSAPVHLASSRYIS